MPLDVSHAALARVADRVLETPPALVAEAPPQPVGVWPYVAVLGGNVADTWTSVDAIRSGRGREANPVLAGSLPRLVSIKAALTVYQVWSVWALGKSGHPTLAKWFGYVAGGGSAALAVHNARVGR